MTFSRIGRILPDSLYISLQYFKHFKRFPNLKNPRTFNEKIQWLKLHDRKPIYTTMVDKLESKKFVAQALSNSEVIIPTIGVWEKPEDIDFDILPNRFVLKWNHDSGTVFICKDKNKIDKNTIVEHFKKFRNHNGYYYAREWAYKNVKPFLFAEEYVENGDGSNKGLTDYKIYCFNGKPSFLYVSSGWGGNHRDVEVSFFDLDFQLMKFQRDDYSQLSFEPVKPERFESMLKYAETLAQGTFFLRVDFYYVAGMIKFSELTFYPCGGLMPFVPPAADIEVGKLLKLPTDRV